MLTDLIIDGNYLLNRISFPLHKNNLLYGGLYSALEASINNYKKIYPFTKIYLVSDSKEKSWRKKLNKEYKANRKRDINMDWEFIFNSYYEFKEDISKRGVKILESPHIEGDDWISFLTHNANLNGRSTIIVSNDYDIKQIINYSLDPLYINIMTNEMMNKKKIFFPKNYQIFIDALDKLKNNNDIFDLNDNWEFLQLINGFIKQYDIHLVDSIECLLIKIISGDISDNIPSVWVQTKNGKKRGIGTKGAKNIFDEYISEFGDPNLQDPDLSENIADIICENRKISKSEILNISKNIENNMEIINLHMNNLPKEVIKKMNSIYVNI